MPATIAGRSRSLWLSAIGFTFCFAVWAIFATIGVRSDNSLRLNEAGLGLLVGVSIVATASGIFSVRTDKFGGAVAHALTMIVAAATAFFHPFAITIPRMRVAASRAGGDVGHDTTHIATSGSL